MESKKVESNRRNGKLGRGPTTPFGKNKSKLNSLKHGFTAKCGVLIEGENPNEYEAMSRSFVEHYNPKTYIQLQYAEELADLWWRIRRERLFEAAVIRFMQHATNDDHQNFVSEDDATRCAVVGSSHSEIQPYIQPADLDSLGGAIASILRTEDDALNKLGKYKMRLLKQYAILLNALDREQDRSSDPPGLASPDAEPSDYSL